MARLAINGGEKAIGKKPKKSALFDEMLKEQESLVVQLLRKREISLSSCVKELEKRWAQYTDTKYCLAMNNGTATLHSAFFSLIDKPGDEIIT
ncbi:MAG: DegT/DnrJ/EryC1/StrS family aminotransferase, partial [Candidatus Omnitrophica bacterium]|nr:DegT/DnrJ/EryC1/StrS family aminotransferase [Candidatus Omnitrophota bacterium]